MQEVKTYEASIAGKQIKTSVGLMANQASGSCLVQLGDTSVLATAQIGQSRPEQGFFPLTCDYEERFYAAGKILGSRFVRREGRPSTEAILAARVIDRTIRPLFPEGLTSEIQVIVTCLSWDAANDPDCLGILGASLALSISEIPWQGPVAAVRIGRVNNELVANPEYEQRAQSDIDIVFSGHKKISEHGATSKDDLVVNMIDGKANEFSEKEMVEIYDFATPYIQELLNFQSQIISQIAKPKLVLATPAIDVDFENAIKAMFQSKLDEALYIGAKKERQGAFDDLKEEIKQKTISDFGDAKVKDAMRVFEVAVENSLKENILKYEKRPDGRRLDEVREISAKVAILPRTHGSSIFQRGETQVLNILTLGSPGDHLLLEGMEISGKQRFMHHYNFPPYAVGEVKRLGSPGRREIGHGMLAEKALIPLLPLFDDFPYTIRAVSEVVSSNGSSSMASVSATCLALMDAGVPIKRPAAGIAIGLIKGKGKEYKILTDIQGPEDHSGEMDFKVAGTEKGITAIQMDVKGEGITKEIFIDALSAAKKARLEILETQNKALSEPRKELSPFAPKIYIVQINPDKIGLVIGSGGKTINAIIDGCGGVGIDIEEDGKVFISSENEENAKKAVEWVKGLTKEFEVGELYQGIIKKITDFGAFVEIAPGQDGLVHISQFTNERIGRVEDVVNVGDKIPVKVIAVDDQGKVSLSAKDAGFQANIKKSAPRMSDSRDRFSNNGNSSERGERGGGGRGSKPRNGFLKRG